MAELKRNPTPPPLTIPIIVASRMRMQDYPVMLLRPPARLFALTGFALRFV